MITSKQFSWLSAVVIGVLVVGIGEGKNTKSALAESIIADNSVQSLTRNSTFPQRRRLGRIFAVDDNVQTSVHSLQNGGQSTALNQVTNVSELRDVQPTDWDYEALTSLVERYGCIVGYPDRTYRGAPRSGSLRDRPLSRWEFAAGLNACMNVMERLLQENAAVLREDIDKLKLLAQQFQQELQAYGQRIDNLETRIAYLEDRQFSVTTKLTGDSIWVLSGVGGSEQADGPPDQPVQNGQVTVNFRQRINFNTSFSGEDNLLVRLQSANFFLARGGSNLTDFNFAATEEQGNLNINKVQYSFPVGDRTRIWLAGNRITMDDIMDPLAPYTNSFTDGAVSFFGAIAPIYLPNDNSGPGAGFSYNFTDELGLGAFYSAGKGFSPNQSEGLFNGQFGVGAQLNYAPAANTGVAFSYLHNYIPQGQYDSFSALGYTGLANTDNPFDDAASSTNHYAVIWTWQLADWFSLEGWGMYSDATAKSGDRQGDKADIWNWKVSFAFPDLGKEGNVGVVSVGQPPYASFISNNNNLPDITPATTDAPWFVETFYLYQFNDNISLTPAFWIGINPANGRDPLWVAALRTSFKF
ncbi:MULTISPECIES: iron uptake porin [unclassified Synechocystis]|uniref:iron uptake porin n=1 Tax=unclassified Synechocystis TaxID=2640012 RepID=UPI00041B59DC|nr:MULTISPECIES: iron uptake porin [unclassified Synechocystis]AIE74048.1 Outer membrane protein [Synechocystis sp. PCC 6714]MCT0252699.1 iron uptake porin [Synechocystis sp. CS-94]